MSYTSKILVVACIALTCVGAMTLNYYINTENKSEYNEVVELLQELFPEAYKEHMRYGYRVHYSGSIYVDSVSMWVPARFFTDDFPVENSYLFSSLFGINNNADNNAILSRLVINNRINSLIDILVPSGTTHCHEIHVMPVREVRNLYWADSLVREVRVALNVGC